MPSIPDSLTDLFTKHQAIFWYAKAGEKDARAEFEALELEGVQKTELDRNSFVVKQAILSAHPDQKFLVFSDQARPPLKYNWLRDLELANHLFTADAAAMHVQDLGLEASLVPTAKQHLSFFGDTTRRATLAEMLNGAQELSPAQFQQHLIAATLRTQPIWQDITIALLRKYASSKTNTIKQLSNFNLLDTYWAAVAKTYGYEATEPTLETLAVYLLQAHFIATLIPDAPTGLPDNASLAEKQDYKIQRKNIALLLTRWKQDRRTHTSFLKVSQQVYKQDKDYVNQILTRLKVKDIRTVDTFKAIDAYILHQLSKGLQQDRLGAKEVSHAKELRIGSVWLQADEELSTCYDAIDAAARLLQVIKTAVYKQSDALATWHSYSSQLSIADEAYRQFHLAYAKGGGAGIDSALKELVDRRYTEEFVYKLNQEWDQRLTTLDNSAAQTLANLAIPKQRNFYRDEVKPMLNEISRIFVLISDGLPFSSAASFRESVNDNTSYTATLRAQIGVIPSYTQLGMAALLPHTTLSIQANSTNVFADNKPTSGIAARSAILADAHDGKAIALSSEDFLAHTADRDTGRDYLKNLELVYIYSDTIDKAGENAPETIPGATEIEFKRLTGLLKRISTMNGLRVLITSDHGYLWQQPDLKDFHYLDAGRPEAEGYKTSRRFVLGEAFNNESGVYGFSESELALEGSTGVAIAKGMLRFRHRGNSGKYAHGGMSLQELMIPIVEVRLRQDKSLQSKPVPISIISLPSKITTLQLPLKLYQTEPVGTNYQSVKASIGVFGADGKLLSNLRKLEFASSSTEARDREQSAKLQLNNFADAYDQQQVFVCLYESHEGEPTALRRNKKLAQHAVLMVRGGFGQDFEF